MQEYWRGWLIRTITMTFLLVRKISKKSSLFVSMILADFRFYDDGADDYKENEGTLLPLWKFTFEKAGKLENTALSWNPAYSDLFAASFGSCESSC